jgi:phospholipid N-methyltransferase
MSAVYCTASAHQFTPTYPQIESSYVDGVSVVKMQLFNKREDVQYYEIQVFDEAWNTIPFVVMNKIINIKFLETKKIDVYIRKNDVAKVRYICSKSRINKETDSSTIVSSRICSKIK